MPIQPMLLTRPGTLAEVLRLVRRENETLRFCLAGFLDEFYSDRDPTSRYARIIDDPGDGRRTDRCIGRRDRRAFEPALGIGVAAGLDRRFGPVSVSPVVHGSGANERFPARR